MDLLLKLLPSAAAVAIVIVVLALARRGLEKGAGPLSATAVRAQLVMLGLTVVGAVGILLVLPISDAMRGQVLSLLGILLSAATALSATTFLGNAMAGVMLRSVRSFRTGDFVRCGEHFGRVSARGLFHVEIQTEDRDLTTLPNLFLVTHPITTVRASGTIVSASVSLGYDVPRKRIEELLIAAAESVDLSEPFVQVAKLGDFSVEYRVAGLLTEVKQLVSTRARLRRAVLDGLHGGGVEIVSPSFMNTRSLPEGKRMVPPRSATAPPPDADDASRLEDLVFDKAEEAESLEGLQLRHQRLLERLKEAEAAASKGNGEEPERARRELEQLARRRERLEAAIAERQKRANAESDD